MTGLLADVHNQGARRQELASQEVMEGFNPHPGALPIVYLQGILCHSSELSGPMYRKSTSVCELADGRGEGGLSLGELSHPSLSC